MVFQHSVEFHPPSRPSIASHQHSANDSLTEKPTLPLNYTLSLHYVLDVQTRSSRYPSLCRSRVHW